MMRLETQFAVDGDLIIVRATVTGPGGTSDGRFVLDTGASLTTMTHELAESVGYVARDGFRRAKVHTAIGEEEGYILRVAELEILGFTMMAFPINVIDLGHDGIDGLLGMNFLSEFNYEVRSAESGSWSRRSRSSTLFHRGSRRCSAVPSFSSTADLVALSSLPRSLLRARLRVAAIAALADSTIAAHVQRCGTGPPHRSAGLRRG